MYFITLSSTDGSEHRVNVQNIAQYYQVEDAHTSVVLTTGKFFGVTEEPTVIDAMIKSIGHGACVVER